MKDTGTSEERRRLDSAAQWYLTEQLEFDKALIRYRYRSMRPYFVGKRCLELGPADGHMTRLLARDFEQITVVDASADLLAAITPLPNLVRVESLFEEFDPDEDFDTILIDHVLEHVERPVDITRRARSWLGPGGRLLAGVPNGDSFHRLVGVKMGLFKHPCELNPRDLAQGHRRVYVPGTFRADLEAAGLRVVHMGGVFFKPLSNQQIDEQWTEEMKEAFYELGKDFPLNAADLFAVCEAA